MMKCKSMVLSQRILSAYVHICNLFNLGRHLVSVANYRFFRQHALAFWRTAVAIKDANLSFIRS